MTISINLSELLPKHFHSLWKATKDREKLNIVAKGGRGSGKSSDISIIITQLIMRYPMNAVVVRKTDNTLATSVFEQIKWAIEEQRCRTCSKLKCRQWKSHMFLEGIGLSLEGRRTLHD